ncbi:hypothetical protein C2E21_8317 [Chlorella sorokiniana]|uniref:Uncharacterized protein n=1 Tax=Chlorella sorokiniana TaxID=3076 RepID=A0A2P6TEX6_CHLSO|nr:hypothetical protein C2E21_8317 [Chlorella sorokiniana]|eukprot:PRW32528.1 hypothetical protein C2E21_8317 [Chlorella sorokiniana]
MATAPCAGGWRALPARLMRAPASSSSSSSSSKGSNRSGSSSGRMVRGPAPKWTQQPCSRRLTPPQGPCCRALRSVICILEQDCQRLEQQAGAAPPARRSDAVQPGGRGANPFKPAALAAAVLGKHTATMRILLQAGAPLWGSTTYHLSSIADLLVKAWKELEWWAEAAPAMQQGGAAAAVKEQ